MKILLGITKSNLGGAQRYVLDLAKELKRQDHDVSVICGGKGALVDRLKQEKIYPAILLTLNRDIYFKDEIKSFFTLLNFLHKHKPDVFHINSSKMGGIGSLAGRLVGIKKVIFTSHGWAFNEPNRSWLQRKSIKFFTWLTIIFSHHTICVSERLKKDVEKLPWVKNKLVVIHNGIEPFDLFLPEVARESLSPKILSSNVVFAAFSELHKVKGLDILLTAWKKFIGVRNAKLLLVGEGDEKANLQKMASNLDILDSVIFTNYLDNARKYLSGIDVVVMPSRSEGLPYAILEAGIAGRPVIASKVGGILEIIDDKQNGILIPKENADALVEALIILYDNPQDRKLLGENLKKTIETKFSLDQMVRDTLLTYGNTK